MSDDLLKREEALTTGVGVPPAMRARANVVNASGRKDITSFNTTYAASIQ